MHTTSEAPVGEPQSVRPPAGPGSTPGVGAVHLAGVGHSFAELEVIERLELTVEPNSVIGIVGPSGCGKSTLLELIAGLLAPTEGLVEVDGSRDEAGRLASCAYMPQRDLLLPWLAAIDNASIALRNRGAGRQDARDAAAPLFRRFGLAGFEDTRPARLSGGMRQRVAFLRTLLAGKPVLLLDEPFAGLDAITRGQMQEWLAEALAAEPHTTILVTHDVEEALYLTDRVLVLSARPARPVAELPSPAPRDLPRLNAITTPAFTAARERATAALLEGHR